jgi:hypothetical protein
MSSRTILCSTLVALAACGDAGDGRASDGRFTTSLRAATILRVDALRDADGASFSGLVANVDEGDARGADAARGIDVHLYAKNPATSFGPRTWIFESDRITAVKTLEAAGRGPTVRLEMPVRASMRIELRGSEDDTVEIWYSQGEETAYCIGAKLSARRCRETGGADCDRKLAAAMKGHADSCPEVDALR